MDQQGDGAPTLSAARGSLATFDPFSWYKECLLLYDPMTAMEVLDELEFHHYTGKMPRWGMFIQQIYSIDDDFVICHHSLEPDD